MFKVSAYKFLHTGTAVLLVLAFALGAPGVQVAHAASLTVNTTADNETPGDGFCTLREAIANANADSDTTSGDCAAGSGADTITFDADYTITLEGQQLPLITSKITVTGNGALDTIIQAAAAPFIATSRVLEVGNTGDLTLESLTIQNGYCIPCATDSNSGGGIYNTGAVTVTNSRILDNRAVFGGGISSTGTMTVTNSTFSGNYGGVGAAPGDGGGIENTGILVVTGSTFSNNSTGGSGVNGGGIFNSFGATATVTNSTFSGNSASGELSAGGGAIRNFGTLTVTNSTFSGNSAYGPYCSNGGGISSSGTITITNSTFAGNSATNSGAGEGPCGLDNFSFGGGLYNSGTLNLTNTILANNSATTNGDDCYNESGDAIATNLKNLIKTNASSGKMCGTPAYTADPNLAALADNGGPTETMALQTGSPAIDAGDDATCAADPVNNLDQRGVTRPQGPHCDIGAFEKETVAPDALVVDTTSDADLQGCLNAVPGDCSLRGTINLANAMTGANTITFDIPASDSGCTAANVCTITLGSTLPSITDADGLTIDGSGQTITVSGNNAVRVMEVNSGAVLEVKSITIANGNPHLNFNCIDESGGGICNIGTLTITNSTFSNNRTDGNDGGGGVYNSGNLTIIESTFSSNGSEFGGGGIANHGTLDITDSAFSGNSGGEDEGGAISNHSGTVVITDTTFSGNHADFGGGIDNLDTMTVTNSTFAGNNATSGGRGGGIRNLGTLTVTNSTFSSNSSLEHTGGGIYNLSTLNVTNSTFSDNSATEGGGIYSIGTATLKNTIVANSTSGGNCAGTITDGGGNLSWGDTTCPGINADPKLLALADNGGPTHTMALDTGSAAIDAGNDATCAAAVGAPNYGAGGRDQRGVTRPIDGDTIPGAVCDIGAYEAPDPAPNVTVDQASGQADPTSNSPINFTVVFSESVTGFDSTDVDLSASTAAGTLSAVVTGGPATYNVAVSGMTSAGDVVASVPANAATDGGSNGNSASTSTDNTVTFVVSSPTTLLYNGAQVAGLGSSFQAAAKLSSPSAACVNGQTISFSLDVNPLNGSAGPYSLGSTLTNSSGQATLPVNTTGWQEGIYIITASFGGTSNCDPSSDSATLTAAAPGNSATGGGWYTLSGSGRVNFGFNVRKVDNKCTSNCAYKGHVLLMNNGKWKLKGTLNSYVKSSAGVGTAGGTGDLYWWDTSLNGGLGDWVLAKSGVTFTISFFDGGSGKKPKTDTFGISIKYTPVSPQPGSLPNSGLTPLKGGDIKVQ